MRCRTDCALTCAQACRYELPQVSAAFRTFVETCFQELNMNKDQVKGRIRESKGKLKEVTGRIVGNKTLEEKGKIQKNFGKVQTSYGDLKSDLKKDIKKSDSV
jgi:uncharacterized protein YjbJ (UPF0337 family)